MFVPAPSRNRRPSADSATAGPVVPVVRLKVTLLELVPPVWRRFQVPANYTLRRLNAVLQQLMGWRESHLHHFQIGDDVFGVPDGDSEKLKDSRWITLQDLLSRNTRRFFYAYASGDGWEHEVRIENIAEGDPTNQRPLCLAGERTCPPEALGGPEGYVRMLEGHQDPRSAEGSLDPNFDPEAFDLEGINAALAALR